MSEKKNISEKDAELRKIAEQKAAQFTENLEILSPEETQHVLHELRVHQIELEMQNEELRTSQAELEASRARYFDLYNLAPVGYVTVSETGIILEANRTASTLLGVMRGTLVNHPISQFILKEDQDIYYLHRRKLFQYAAQAFELRMLTKEGTIFWAHLEMRIAETPSTDSTKPPQSSSGKETEGASMFRIVISDITELKQAQDESLRKTTQHYAQLLANTRLIQEQMRCLSRRPARVETSQFSRAGHVRKKEANLTLREYEVLQLIAEGRNNKEVASDLNVSVKTVEKHRQNVMRKLDLHDTSALTRYAISMGFIENIVKHTIISPT